jgi:hypothetical protein
VDAGEQLRAMACVDAGEQLRVMACVDRNEQLRVEACVDAGEQLRVIACVNAEGMVVSDEIMCGSVGVGDFISAGIFCGYIQKAMGSNECARHNGYTSETEGPRELENGECFRTVKSGMLRR